MKKFPKELTLFLVFAGALLVIGAVRIFVLENRAEQQVIAASVAQNAVTQHDNTAIADALTSIPSTSAVTLPNAQNGDVLGANTIDTTNYMPVLVKNMPATGVPVLMYHHVGDLPPNPDAIRKDLTVPTAAFAAQMDYLQSNGYHAVSTEQLYLATQGEYTLPSKPVAITFDDGYQDVFDNAVPILLAHKMVGSFGIITQFVGQPDYASWAAIAAAKFHGMEIVSHSEHHIDFTSKKYRVVDKNTEIAGSLLDLQNQLAQKTNIFIYPYGHNDVVTQSLLAKNGIDLAFTVAFGAMRNGQNMLAVPRVRVHGQNSLDRFIQALNISQGKAKTAKR